MANPECVCGIDSCGEVYILCLPGMKGDDVSLILIAAIVDQILSSYECESPTFPSPPPFESSGARGTDNNAVTSEAGQDVPLAKAPHFTD